ncbi:MAG: DsrE family protein [Planctomycetes bacterium]|nr:DsrE family protein [Planctomycetota bacterium]
MKELIGNVLAQGGTIMVCPPCAKGRGYGDGAFVDGVIVAGAAAMLEVVQRGATTLSF